MDTKKLAIGQRLKFARLRLGISQRDFALTLSTTPNHICQLERGRCIPGSKLLRAMRVHYSININWLLTGNHSTAARTALSQEVKALVGHYQRADQEGRAILCSAAEFLAHGRLH